MNPVLVDGVLWVPRRAERPGIIGDYMAPLEQSDPEYDEWMEMAVQAEPGVSWAGLEEALVAAAWDESKHPRHPRGESLGGKFANKGEVSAELMAPNVQLLSTLRTELGGWKEQEPREYATRALDGTSRDGGWGRTMDHTGILAVRRDGELIGVGDMSWDDVEGPVAGGSFGAVKGGGLPLFDAFLNHAVSLGKGATWAAGNDRSKQLYDRLGIPKMFEPTQAEYAESDHELYPTFDDYYDAWDEEFGGQYELTPEQVKQLADDMFSLARSRTAALEVMVAAGWVAEQHPRHPAGSERGGQWRSILEGESSSYLVEVGQHADDAAAMARTILEERGEPFQERPPAERWTAADEQMSQRVAELKSFWETEDGRHNDYYSDPYRVWADEQFGQGGRSTLPDDWQKGWTWGEDAEDVDRVIYDSSPLREDIAVWRGAYNERGSPSTRPISTSFSKYVAASYADRTGRGKEEHLHRVLVPAGSRVGWHTNESEVVLPTGTTLEPVGPNMWVARVPDTMVEGFRSSGWDESKHPRDPGGEGGGQFVEAGTVGTDEAPVMGLGNDSQLDWAQRHYVYPPEQQRMIEQRLREFLDEADLQMRVPEDAMMEVFQDGRFMNQHEHGEGARGMPRDVKSEASMLGLPIETTAGQLPKYAYLGPDTDAVNMYGPIKLHFKDGVKDRATFTIGDSLMTNGLPSKIREPRWQSAMSAAYGGDPVTTDWNEALLNGDLEYVEAQIYGRLTPDDIEYVEILDDQYWEDEDPMTGMPMVSNVGQMGAVIEELNRRKIPWSTYIPEGDFSGEWA